MENKHTRSVSLIDGHTEEMTGAEVIKALECHLNSETNCDECPYKDLKKTNGSCVGKMLEDALDLIKRQQAEIERLNVELVGMRGACESYKMHYDNAQTEIELLHKTKQLIKSEAIKEFWKRFDKVLCENIGPSKRVYWKISSDGNDLVKEMTEVKEN